MPQLPKSVQMAAIGKFCCRDHWPSSTSVLSSPNSQNLSKWPPLENSAGITGSLVKVFCHAPTLKICPNGRHWKFCCRHHWPSDTSVLSCPNSQNLSKWPPLGVVQVLEYFGIFWNILEYFGIFWNILEYFGIFWHTLEYFGKNWIILEYFGIFSNIFEYFEIYWNNLE